MIEIINADITTASEKYILHQTNCVSNYAAGVAKAIFDKFPYANCYKNRKDSDIPGSIIVCGGKGKKNIINLMGQYYPGYPNDGNDNYLKRKDYFLSGLNKIEMIENLESIAIPFLIGCGLAGGDWAVYSKMIHDFTDRVAGRAKVRLYQWP